MLIKSKQEIQDNILITLCFLPLLQYHFYSHLFKGYLIKKNFQRKIWVASSKRNFMSNYFVHRCQIIIDRIFNYFEYCLLNLITTLFLYYCWTNLRSIWNWAVYFEYLDLRTFASSFFVDRILVIWLDFRRERFFTTFRPIWRFFIRRDYQCWRCLWLTRCRGNI